MRRIIICSLLALGVCSPSALAHGFIVIPRNSTTFPVYGPHVNFVATLPAGHFTAATLGTYSASTGAFVPGITGNSILRGVGAFTPTNGTFMPAANGNFLLITRQTFNPKTGTFMPSSTGTFVFATRGNLVSSGKDVGTFLPSTALVPVRLPSALATVGVAPYVNPYLPSQMNPYTTLSAVPYPAYPLSSYGGAYGDGMSANPYTPVSSMSAESSPQAALRVSQQAALSGHGIPSQNGHITWPLAFRNMSPAKQQELLDPLEGQIVNALTQGAEGTVVNAKKGVMKLGQWLTDQQTGMAEGTYITVRTFLRTLDEALGTL